jgi:ribosomal protein S18 acetylase RimI-like enzyme
MTAFTLEVRASKPGDAERLLELHARALRAAGVGPARDLAELRWRYEEAPHGACVAFALAPDGRALAAVAATRHRARIEGSAGHWLELGDLCNDFAAGAGLDRARGLRLAGTAFAETFGGFPPEKHPLVYGLPSRRAHRFGLRVLEWEVLRSENELHLALARAPAEAGAGVEVQELASFPPEVERAFETAAAGRAALLVKDAAYLNWRYVRRPGARFERLLARRAGEAVGFAVLAGGVLHEWSARPDDEEVVRALLAACVTRARRAGARELAAVFPDTAPEWLLFQRLGFRVRGTREYLCFRSFQRPAIMSWLFQHGSYTRGDTLR